MSALPKKLKQEQKQKIIKEILEKLLFLMGIKNIKLDFSLQEENTIYLDIDCLNPGILIGVRGKTIDSLQLILRLIFYKKTGVWQNIILNAAGYRQHREEDLKKLALNVAQKVELLKQEEKLFNLNASERRIIHLALQDDDKITTESEGEGKDRVLIIKLKDK